MHPLTPAGLAPPDVTRLASVGGLDRLGIHVWQAVRPLGRSLSVHMGKGLDPAQAMASALGEAREYADCEAYRPARTRARWRNLPVAERPLAPDDFAVRRGALSADSSLDWSRLDGLASPPLWVPSDAIDIDYTRNGQAGVARDTTGQATAATHDQALRRALVECIERDAVARHQRLGPGGRRAMAIDVASVEFGWFRAFRTRTLALGMAVGIDRLPAIGGFPAFQLTITEAGGASAACRRTGGWGAGFTSEAALLAAMLEAAQSRAGYIAGARDDLDLRPADPVAPPDWLTVSASRRFVVAGDEPVDDHAAVAALCDSLAAVGCRQIGYAVTSAAAAPWVTVKCFVPGLANGEREARVPV
jgi:ribosomal protein S12 methylthiotransferase accessory factor